MSYIQPLMRLSAFTAVSVGATCPQGLLHLVGVNAAIYKAYYGVLNQTRFAWTCFSTPPLCI